MGVNNNNNIYNFLFRDTCINGGTCIKQVEIYFFYFHTFFRSSHQRCFVKKGVLRKFAKFTGKHLCQKVFFDKVAGLPESLFRQRVSGTGVFLWILRNIWEHLSYRTPPDDCFCFFWQYYQPWTNLITIEKSSPVWQKLSNDYK